MAQANADDIRCCDEDFIFQAFNPYYCLAKGVFLFVEGLSDKAVHSNYLGSYKPRSVLIRPFNDDSILHVEELKADT